MESSHFDVAVVGAGPGGYVAAIRAAQLGARVCLIERDKIGGTCLNRGCIPTKALVASVEKYLAVKQAAEYGIIVGDVQIDFPAMISRTKGVVDRLVQGIEYLMRKRKITCIQGRAAFNDPHTLSVQAAGQTTIVTADKFILAPGSKPMVFPAFAYDGSRVVTSDELLHLDKLPRSMVIIGGGVIGCEYASIFQSLGTQVTVVEALPTILPQMDKELVRQLASYLKRQGIKLLTGVKVSEVVKDDMQVTVQMENGKSVSGDIVLVAVGRRANTTGLNLEKAGLSVNEKAEIIVDDRMQTAVPHIYAVGDACSSPWKLAHVASYQGIVAAHQCLGDAQEVMDYSAVPAVVFTTPEVAAVGVTVESAAEAGMEIVSAKFSFMASGKAVAAGHTAGFVKIIARKDNQQIVGAHIIGDQASNLIAELALAVRNQLTVNHLTRTIHAHPTLAEAVLEAAEGINNQTIHA
ncbi:MAG TPA: dihydrolipoyl dehydrogenase [Firmicutes bacterium]|jgi:dihydrolipoamide dehydrogenase|nr:dihydrolipoyl dehydrogenase [Bacillota bacterium]